MRKLFIALLMVALPLASAVAVGDGFLARGVGKILLGGHHEDHGEDGVLIFDFSLRCEGGAVQGSLLAAGEGIDHGEDFPDLILRIPRIQYAYRDGDTVFFAGEGFVIFEEAFIIAWAKHAEGALEGDEFMVYALSPLGGMYWQGGGHLASGFVHIGPVD
jgi:hypothetical protein